MKLRVNIIGLNETTHTSLVMFIKSLGHQVVVSTIPESCCHHKHDRKKCLQHQPCCDVLIFGPDFIARHGLKNINACKIATADIAVMSPTWSGDVKQKELNRKYKVLNLPFECFDIHCWLNNISQSRAYPAKEEDNAFKKIL